MANTNLENQSMLAFIRSSYENLGKHSYLDFYGRKISYDAFFAYVDDCAENFARFGVGKGTVVTLVLPNCPQFLIAVYALSKLGAICSMLSPLMSQNAIEKAMAKTESKIILISTLSTYEFSEAKVIRVHFNYFMPVVKKVALALKKHESSGFSFENLLAKTYEPYIVKEEVDPEAPAFYLHSGGTTGEAKTVILSQKAVNYCAITISENLRDNDLKAEDDVTCAYILPLFYGYGLGVIHTQLYNGYNNVVRAKFKAEELAKEFAKYDINMMFGVPIMYSRMLRTGLWNDQKVKNLKLCYIGGEKMTAELNDAFRKNFKEAVLVEGYGMTEAVTAFVACSKKAYKKDSCGKVGNLIRIEAFDEYGKIAPRGKDGELCVCTEAVMLGYFNDEEATRVTLFEHDGKTWLRTGDYGRVDEEGFVFLIQRIKNIIKRKGINIFPSEVECCIADLSFIKDVKVFGYKDKNDVERIICSVIVTDEAPENYVEVIKNHVKDHISILSMPEYVMVMENFPMTTVGKVDVKKMVEKIKNNLFE